VVVKSYCTDLGIGASLARSLIHYNFAKKKINKPIDSTALYIAKQIIDRIYDKCADQIGFSAIEKRGDYHRFFDQVVYIPSSFSGKMPNGDPINPGVKFLDIRSKYKQDPGFAALQRAVTANDTPSFRYHRFWAQCEIALAFAEYARFSQPDPNISPIIVSKDSINKVIQKIGVLNPTKEYVRSQGVTVTKSGSCVAITSTYQEPVTIRLMDVAGRSICSSELKAMGSLAIKTESLKSGYYLIQVNEGSKVRMVQSLMMMR
jgi:hypothetical protein